VSNLVFAPTTADGVPSVHLHSAANDAVADALVFTDEERKGWLIESAKVLGPQTMARRVIAVIVTSLWGILTLAMAGVILLGHAQIDAFAELYTRVCLIFGGVMAFYFGTALIRAKN
jgi:hypothetical protein